MSLENNSNSVNNQELINNASNNLIPEVFRNKSNQEWEKMNGLNNKLITNLSEGRSFGKQEKNKKLLAKVVDLMTGAVIYSANSKFKNDLDEYPPHRA